MISFWFAGAVALAGTPQAGPAEPVSIPIAVAVPQASPVPADIVADEAIPPVELYDLATERYRRLTVPVTIGGRGPFNFLVDTGAQATVLSRDLADQLDLGERDTATLVGMASSRVVETVIVEDFAIGERTMTIRAAPIVDRVHIGGADGILGLDTLQDLRVLLDFEQTTMAVTDQFGAGGTRGYDIVVRARERLGQLIIHQARIDGIAVDVIIDTGATGSVGNLALRDRLQRARLEESATMTDVNGVQITGEQRVARRLQLGRVQVNNVTVAFADSPTFHGLGLVDEPAMILGMSELRMFGRVAIDFETRRVLFDLPGDISLDYAFRFNGRATRLQQR